jgi:uncharacterized protein YkwD
LIKQESSINKILAVRRFTLAACLLLCVALLVPTGIASGAGAGAAEVSAVAKAEHAIRGCANRKRRAAGLEPLRASGVLTKAARLHARNMATQGFFEHTDTQDRGPTERVELFDGQNEFAFVGENIAAGYGSVAEACQGWMNSSGHRANILGDQYTHIGGGFTRGGSYGRYYVQVFARVSRAAPRG